MNPIYLQENQNCHNTILPNLGRAKQAFQMKLNDKIKKGKHLNHPEQNQKITAILHYFIIIIPAADFSLCVYVSECVLQQASLTVWSILF